MVWRTAKNGRPTKWTKKTAAHSPSAKFNYFLLAYSYCVTNVGGTYNTTKIHEIKDIRGQEKDEKDQKMVSHQQRFMDLFYDSIYSLLWITNNLL